MDFLELFNNLNRGITEKLYLFYGEEELLKREAVSKIKELVVPPSMEELNFTVIDGSRATAEKIADAVETLPFMSDKRMILIKDINLSATGKDRLRQEELDGLERCLQNIPDYSCVVITTKYNVDMRTRLVKSIKENGAVIEFSRLKPGLFEKWVKRQFDNRCKKLKPVVLKRFVEQVAYLDKNSGKTLDDVINEIDKLSEFCKGKDYIDEEDIQAVIPKSLELNIFKLVDSVGYRNTAAAIKLLEDMKLAGEPALKVLFMIARQFRLLYQAACLKDAGYSSKAIASKLRIQPFVVTSLLKQLDNFTRKDLGEAIRACSGIDVRIKTGKVEPWLALELLIASLGEKSNKKSVL
jgi:DNA polymerase-3 subunit delta